MRNQILERRNDLFNFGRGAANGRERGRSKTKKVTASSVRGRSCTLNFVCLASKFATKSPSSMEKIKLQKAGHGVKKLHCFLG